MLDTEPIIYGCGVGEFVGCEQIVRQLGETLGMFREAEARGEWSRIHGAHYDWWMFPIDQPSSHGYAYTVGPADVNELKDTPGFIADYLDGVRILLLSWGWDLHRRSLVDQPAHDQVWQHWPIRLEKCGRSLRLFDERSAYASVRDYTLTLIRNEVPLMYRGRDCGDLFLEQGSGELGRRESRP